MTVSDLDSLERLVCQYDSPIRVATAQGRVSHVEVGEGRLELIAPVHPELAARIRLERLE